MSRTLTLEIPEEVYEPLAKSAEQTGKTPEQMAVQLMTECVRQLADDPVEKFIGAFDSRIPDWADHHDKYIGEELLKHTLGGADTDAGNAR